jgi:exopolysaccharide production protein ExoZ
VPMYWVAITLKVLVSLALPHLVLHNSFDLARTVGSYLFIPMFNAGGYVQPVLGVGWTLMHEMYFYLVFACALALGLRPVWWVSLFIVAQCLIGLVWPATSAPMLLATHTINLYFVIGMLAGTVLTTTHGVGRWRLVFIAGLLLLAGLGWFAPSAISHFAIQPVALVLAAAMVFAYEWRLPSFANVFIRLGESSYALYLFHTFYSTACLLFLHRTFPQWSPWGNIWLSVMIAIPVGHVIYVWLERPVTNQLNGRLFSKAMRPAK